MPKFYLEVINQISHAIDVIDTEEVVRLPITPSPEPLQNNLELVRQLVQGNNEEEGNAWIIARDFSVAYFSWPNGEVTFFPYSRNGFHFSKVDYWLAYLPFLEKLEPRKYYIDLSYFNQQYQIKDLCVLVGGHHQFGHFLFDVLPSLATIDTLHLQKDTPSFISKFTTWERDIAQTLFGEINFLELPKIPSAVFHFDRLALPLFTSYQDKYAYIREKVIGGVNLTRRPNLVESREIYIKRSTAERSQRVANSGEVERYLKDKGFFICEGGSLNCGKMAELVFQADLVVADPITPHLNFNAFSNDSASLISLIPEWICNSPDQRVLNSGLAHYLPVLDRTIFCGGINNESELRHDVSSTYDVDRIEEAINKLRDR